MISGLITLLVATSVTILVCPPVILLLKRQSMVDTATSRSSHIGEVPRGGGLALLAGITAALVLVADSWWRQKGIPELCLTAAVFGLIGIADDLHSLKATVRLVLQIVVASSFALAISISSDVVSSVQTAVIVGVVIVTFVNAFNFMDGINGISAATATIIGTSLAIASYRWDGGIELPALALVGSALGFAPFNLANRIFLGDVGSYLLGSALVMLAIVGVQHGMPIVAVVLPFTLYLGDVFYTLGRRASRHEAILEAHREHVYQRLANERGLGHQRTTVIVSGFTFLLVAAGQSSTPTTIALILGAAAVASYLTLPRLTLVLSER